MDVQVETAMEQLRAKDKDIDKYSLLQTLQDGSEAVYYGMLMRHTRECMPLVYTPTGIRQHTSHTSAYVSIRQHASAHARVHAACLHAHRYTTMCVRMLLCVSAYDYICVLILVYMSACRSSTRSELCSYRCVRILLYMCPHTTMYMNASYAHADVC